MSEPINTDYGFGETHPFEVDAVFAQYFTFGIGDRVRIKYRNMYDGNHHRVNQTL